MILCALILSGFLIYTKEFCICTSIESEVISIEYNKVQLRLNTDICMLVNGNWLAQNCIHKINQMNIKFCKNEKKNLF